MIKKLRISGFKSVRESEVVLGDLNVLIGANGAGKSNLLSAFKMLSQIVQCKLQYYVAKTGGASSLLHYGPKMTPKMKLGIELEQDDQRVDYSVQLEYAADDSLIAAAEKLIQHDERLDPKSCDLSWKGAGREAPLATFGEQDSGFQLQCTGKGQHDLGRMASAQLKVLRNRFARLCRVYQFHDTSPTAKVRQHCDVDNNRYLEEDAGNLAAILYRIHEVERNYYERIVGTIRQVAPFFGDFVLNPSRLNPHVISLRWKERQSEYEFGAHQMPDGLLRAIALVTLLFQPEVDLPAILIVDEPELGLHPYAVETIASLFRAAALHTQILLATQSTLFLDQFVPEDVFVVDRKQGNTSFARPTPSDLSEWLKEYSLSELWEKNVLGGTPGR